MPLVIGVLGSGEGTNFQAIADAIAAGSLRNVGIGIVLSDREDARILERAHAAGAPARWIDPGRFKTKLEPEAEAQYVAALQEHDVELVVLAGFMRILKAPFLAAYPARIINIHPSLLPAFPGIAAWKQALAAGVKVTGCTVHTIDAEIDQGPILAQAAVPVAWDDTPDSLLARIHGQEHRLYPQVIQAFADGRVAQAGPHTHILPDAGAPAGSL